jgi:uncharacterized protein HemX
MSASKINQVSSESNQTTSATPPSKRSIGVARNERGEGVISMAIAVLIMAALGAILFGIYQKSFSDSAERAGKIVENIDETP